MRLQSTKWVIFLLPFTSIAYAWLAEEKIHVATVCAALFFAGFFSVYVDLMNNIWVY